MYRQGNNAICRSLGNFERGDHHLVKVQVAIFVVVAHDGCSLPNRHGVTDADQVIVRHIQGVNDNVLANVGPLRDTQWHFIA